MLTAIAALLVDEDHKLRTGAAALLSELLTQVPQVRAGGGAATVRRRGCEGFKLVFGNHNSFYLLILE